MSVILSNIIITVILIAVVAGAVYYIYRSKKRGDKCVGCPYAKSCGGKCGGTDKKE